ncbi:MAG: hypothetical protein U5R30_07190 [Deltaproteobacteria bacterium]|nr:hypothetical protein [Deltaproteobacteria bacterium]
MNVGHTRAFPSDGVFFNKRKWMMKVIPDHDGVTNIAVKFNIPNQRAAGLIYSFPFIFQTKDGLNLLCSLNMREQATSQQIKSLHKRFWTEGLRSMFVFARGRFFPLRQLIIAENLWVPLAV